MAKVQSTKKVSNNPPISVAGKELIHLPLKQRHLPEFTSTTLQDGIYSR